MFALVWTEHALDDLADVWVAVDPPTRDRIEAAIHRLNADLRQNPNEVGESRDGNRRIGFAGPLIVVFRVDMNARTVRVNHAWIPEKR
jgi:plasmid stabilization system protein ParE